MSYIIIRDALIALLRDIPGFDDSNVAYEDYQSLNAGMERAIIVEYNSFNRTRQTFQGEDFIDWEFDVQLYNQFSDNVAVSQNEQDIDRESILQKLAQLPELDGTAGVFDAYAASGNPDPYPIQLGSGRFIKEKIAVHVIEDVSFTALE